MVQIDVDMRSGHMRIVADGHANSAPYGQDIVCAAVSAILQTAVLGLQAIADSYPDHIQLRYGDADQTTPDSGNDTGV